MILKVVLWLPLLCEWTGIELFPYCWSSNLSPHFFPPEHFCCMFFYICDETNMNWVLCTDQAPCLVLEFRKAKIWSLVWEHLVCRRGPKSNRKARKFMSLVIKKISRCYLRCLGAVSQRRLFGLTNWVLILTPETHHWGNFPCLWQWIFFFLQTESQPDLLRFGALTQLTGNRAHSALKYLQSLHDTVVLESEKSGFNPVLLVFSCHSYSQWDVVNV